MNFQKLADKNLGIELIQITFTVEEYEKFLFLQGLAIGSLCAIKDPGQDRKLAQELLKFIDNMNRENIRWDRYFDDKGEPISDP